PKIHKLHITGVPPRPTTSAAPGKLRNTRSTSRTTIEPKMEDAGHSGARRGPRSNPRHQGAGVQDVHVLAIGLDTQRGTPLLLVAEQTGRRRALPLSIG